MNFRQTLKSAVFAITAAFMSTTVFAEELKIGLVQINQQALFFNQMNEGANTAAEAAGVELFIFNANNENISGLNAPASFEQVFFSLNKSS